MDYSNTASHVESPTTREGTVGSAQWTSAVFLHTAALPAPTPVRVLWVRLGPQGRYVTRVGTIASTGSATEVADGQEG